MSIDAETLRAATELVKAATAPCEKLFAFIADSTGIGPRVVLKRAETDAKRIRILSSAESKAIEDRAKAEKRAAEVKAKGDAQASLILERARIKKRTLQDRAKKTG